MWAFGGQNSARDDDAEEFRGQTLARDKDAWGSSGKNLAPRNDFKRWMATWATGMD